MNANYRFLLVLTLLTGYFSTAQNDDDYEKHPLLEDRFVFTGGVFFPDRTLKLSVDGNISLPPDASLPVEPPDEDIDFGENFAITEYQSTFNAGFHWRFAKKWKLFADYFGTYNRWEAILDEAIEWEDVVYDVGAEVRAGIDLGIIRSVVGRVLSQGNQHELGIGLGAHVMVLSVFIEGEASIIGEEDGLTSDFHRGDVDATAPLPNLGAWYHWAPSNKWLLAAEVDWLYIAFGDFQGGLWDLKGGVQYQIIDWFGVGASYRYFGINLEVDKSDWKGGLEMNYSGPAVMVNFNF